MEISLVSIIMPNYNSEHYIAGTIESIINQTYSNWELLITDDCSSDNSTNIIESYCAKDSRIKLFKLENNSGAGVARNNSIKQANGKFIAFCDSDDRWFPNKLELQLDFMMKHGYAFSFTACNLYDGNGNLYGHQSVPKKVTYCSMLRNCAVPSSTAMYDASILGKMYMPKIRKRQDWGLWLDIVKKCGAGYGLNETLMNYLMRNDSISANKLSLLKYNYNVYHEHLGYSTMVSYALLYFYFMPTYVIKRIRIKLKI